MVAPQQHASGASEHQQGAIPASNAHLLATLLAFYGLAVLLSLVLFVAVIYAGIFNSVSILFYRGIVALAAIAPALFLALAAILRLRWPAGVLAQRDAMVGTILALALNLTAFVLGPVTADRSISVYMLSRLAAAQVPLTDSDLELAFAAQYVCEWDQIGRRLNEQVASGNIVQIPGGYRLTPQGEAFVRTARIVSQMFGGDPRFVGMEKTIAVATSDDHGPLPISPPAFAQTIPCKH